MTRHRQTIMTRFVLLLSILLPAALVAGEGIASADTLADLCKKVDCGALGGVQCVAPKIEAAMLFSNVTPGGTVAIKGCGFGSTKGSFRLKLVDHKGAAKAVWLDIIDWTHTLVSGTIPADVLHVKDQPAKLLVVTKANAASNELPVNFRATLDIKLLPMSDLTWFCGDDASSNWCDGDLFSHSPFCFTPFGGASGTSAAGRHYTCHNWFDDDSGTDVHLAALKNGWVVHSFDWTEHTARDGVEGVCSQVHPYNFKTGISVATVTVDWITCNYHGLVMYEMDISITGFAGVPHK